MATIREHIQSVISGISDMFARLGEVLQAINNQPSYTADMTQIKALLTEIRDKPTELTGTETITFDTTPIVQAITDLRGIGPENTVKSVNQSIWNLAGTAPGKSVQELYDLLEAALMTQAQAPDPSMPYLLQLRSILGIYGDGDPQYGNIRYLVDEMHQALGDGLFTQTTPRKPYLLDLHTVLSDIDYTIGERNSEDISLYELIEDMELGIQQQLVLDSATGIPPTSECSSPYKSNALFLIPVSNLIYAQFPDPPPDGVTFGTHFGLVEDRGELHSDDWSGAKVYVQSNASQFAMDMSSTRYSTNQWIDMAGSGSRSFSVSNEYELQVYLCYPQPVAPEGYTFTYSETKPVDTFAGTRYIPDWDGKYGFPLVGNAVDNHVIFVLGEWGGWGYQTTGPNMYVGWSLPNSTDTTFGNSSSGTLPMTVGGQTEYLLVIMSRDSTFEAILQPPA